MEVSSAASSYQSGLDAVGQNGRKEPSQRYQAESSATPTPGMRVSKAEKDPALEKSLEVRKSEARDSVGSGGQKVGDSDSSSEAGAENYSGKTESEHSADGYSGPSGSATQAAESVTQGVAQQPQSSSIPAEVSIQAERGQPVGELNAIWDLSAQDKRVIRLANGLKEIRLGQSGGGDDYEKFLELAVGFLCSKKCRFTDKEIGTMILLHSALRGGANQTQINRSEFTQAMMALDMSKDKGALSEELIHMLSRFDDTKELMSVYNDVIPDEAPHKLKSNLTKVVFRYAVDRFSKTVWQLEQRLRDDISGRSSKYSKREETLVSEEGLYRKTGVKELDDQKITYQFKKAMEGFDEYERGSKASVDRTSDARLKKREYVQFWTQDSLKELSEDLIRLSTFQERLVVYTGKKGNIFSPDQGTAISIPKSLKRYLNTGNHRLGEKSVVALFPCYLKHQDFKVGDEIDSKFLQIQLACHWEGSDAGMRMWNELTGQEKKVMRDRAIGAAVDEFIPGRQEFRAAMKGKDAAREAARVDKKESAESRQQAEVFFERVLAPGQSEAKELSSLEMPLSLALESDVQPNMALQAFRKGGRQLEKLHKQTAKAAETFKQKLKNEVGIKQMDCRYLTHDFLRGVEDFRNAFEAFQPKEPETSSDKSRKAFFAKFKH